MPEAAQGNVRTVADMRRRTQSAAGNWRLTCVTSCRVPASSTPDAMPPYLDRLYQIAELADGMERSRLPGPAPTASPGAPAACFAREQRRKVAKGERDRGRLSRRIRRWAGVVRVPVRAARRAGDRKSTRLNSTHGSISY